MVDKSGSMADVLDQTVSGYNEQLQQIGIVQKEFPEQMMTVGLTTFNGQVDHQYYGVPVGNALWLAASRYVPEGTTALLDAIGTSVQRLEQQQLTDLDQFETTIVLIILTDGYENSSRSFRLEEIRRTIGRLQASGKWTFSFIGATLDAVDVAKEMNIKSSNSFAFSKDEMKKDVWDKVGGSVRTYASRRRENKNLDDLYN